MSDDGNLAGDDVKLVRYVITSIERDRERVLPEGEGYRIVTDSMSGESFSTWTIARYLQTKGHEELTESEKKYLRVCYQVCGRWPRQSLRFEEKQLRRLGSIAEAIRERNRRRGGGEPSEGEKEVLQAIEDLGGSATIGQLLSVTGRPRPEVQATLDAMVAAGRLSRTGRGVTARYRASAAA